MNVPDAGCFSAKLAHHPNTIEVPQGLSVATDLFKHRGDAALMKEIAVGQAHRKVTMSQML